MKKIVQISFVLLTTLFCYSQVTLVNPITLKQSPTPTNKEIIYTIGLTNNFTRGYIYTYLSKDNKLSSDDVLLGARRTSGHYFDNNAVMEIDYYITKEVPKGKYYIISRVEVNLEAGTSWFKENFSSNGVYCINIQDNLSCDGAPDLVIDYSGATITSDCTSCPPGVNLNPSGNSTHFVSKFGISVNNLKIKNIGNASSNACIVKTYIGLAKDQPTYDLNVNPSIYGLSPNGNQNISLDIPLFQFSQYKNMLTSGGKYYLVIRVDPNNGVKESNENNNMLSIPIYIYTYSMNKISSNVEEKSDTPTEVIDSDIQISPNPSTGIFKIFFKNIQNGKLSIADINGNEIYTRQLNEETEFEVDIQSYPSGIYIVRFQSGDKVIMKKIIKN